MWITSVPAPSTRAPILFRTRPSSSTSGSRAQFTSVVRPFASAAAIMMFSVPVTVGMSKTTSAPLSLPHSAWMYPPASRIVAPSASSALRCWSTGREPIWHPPGRLTLARP